MNKIEFINELKKRLYFLPNDEVEERISFYVEAIDDRIEDGYDEEYAVYKAGSIDDIVLEITQETPFSKILREKVKPNKSLTPLQFTLLILGSPIWFSLLIALFVVVISLYATFLAVVISLWAVLIAFIITSVAGIILGAVYSITGKLVAGLAIISCSVTLIGLSILTYYACVYISKGAIILFKKLVLKLKAWLIKEKAQ